MLQLRHHLLPLLLLPLWLTPLMAEKVDLGQIDIAPLRAEYLLRKTELDERRIEVLQQMLTREQEEYRRRLNRARITRNAVQEMDATQALKLFGEALAQLEAEGDFELPQRTRPALQRTIDLCIRTRQSEDETHKAAIRRLNNEFAVRLQPLLTAAGELIAQPDLLQARWQEVLDYEPPRAAPQQPNVTAADSTAGQENGADVGDVIDSRGEAAKWLPLARVELTVNAMEIIQLPLFALDRPVTRSGIGVQSRARWQAEVTPLLNLAKPTAATPALRIRAITDLLPLEVAEWPSLRNEWDIVVRLRQQPTPPTKHGVIVEIDAAASRQQPTR